MSKTGRDASAALRTSAKAGCIITILLVLLIPLLYPIWLPWIGEFLVVADPLQKADALVILAGDENERIAAGAGLFKQGYASWFVLTDMRLDIPNSQGIYSATVKRKAVAQGVPADRILIVPGQVASTDEEVYRLRAYTDSMGFDSLIVVTSSFHTRRTRWLLNEAFHGSGVTLIVRPALNDDYRADAWWQYPMDRQITGLEYAKILAHLVGCWGYDDCGPIPGKWLKSWQNLSTVE